MTRYDICEQNGMFTVVETATGEIAKVNDCWMESLDFADADDMADLLNAVAAKNSWKSH